MGTRETLHRCFAEGVKLMKGKTERDRVRPIAKHFAAVPTIGRFLLSAIPPSRTPLMQGAPKGKAQ